MKVLFINQGPFPYPASSGCSVQTYSILKSLVLAKVEVYLFNFNVLSIGFGLSEAVSDLQSMGIKVQLSSKKCDTIHPKGFIGQLHFCLKRPIEEFYNGVYFKDEVSEIIQNFQPDLVFAYTMNALMSYDYQKFKIGFAFSNVDLDRMVLKFRNKYSDSLGAKLSLKRKLKYSRSKILDNLLIEKGKLSVFCFEHAFNHYLWMRDRGVKNVEYFPVNVLNHEIEDFENFPLTSRINIALLGNLNGVATRSGIIDFANNYLNIFECSDIVNVFNFNIIGSGDIESDLKEKLLKYPNIYFNGYMSNVDDVYRNNNILFVPTPIPLGFRTRIVEAFSFGMCVITHKANSDAMPEFEDNVNGFVYSTREELISILLKIIERPFLVRTTGQMAKSTFEQKLDGIKVGQIMVDKLKKTIK